MPRDSSPQRPLSAAEGGAIRGGEHDGFTRIVLEIEPATEWSLETGADRATIRFPGRRLAFDTGGVFDRIPRSRILAVTATEAAGGSEVSVDLGCECRVSTSFVGARWLALDVADRDAPLSPTADAAPPPETAEERARREADAVASAEGVLIQQIVRAADQGIIQMSASPAGAATSAATATPDPKPSAKSDAKATPISRTSPAAPVATANEKGSFETELAALLAGDQVAATTVYDRDSQAALAARGRRSRPDGVPAGREVRHRVLVGGRPLSEQLPVLRGQLIGEFDLANPEGLARLARLYIRFGFGAEAEALLAGFDGGPEPEDRALLVDMARTVEGRPATAGGRLRWRTPVPGSMACGRRSARVAPVWRDAAGLCRCRRLSRRCRLTCGCSWGPASRRG